MGVIPLPGPLLSLARVIAYRSTSTVISSSVPEKLGVGRSIGGGLAPLALANERVKLLGQQY